MPRLTWHVTSEQTLVASPSPATNVRFATDSTVYLSRLMDGVSIVALGPPARVERQVMADARQTGMVSFERLAVSQRYLVASAKYNTLGYRPLPSGESSQLYPFRRLSVGIIEALDLGGNRLLVLGDPPRSGPVSPSGAIAWIGTLSRSFAKSATPVLFGATGAGARHLDNCSGLGLGSVRFLYGGSYLVVPGVEPGAYLYAPSGKLLRRFSSEEIGTDTNCIGMSDAEGVAFHKVPGRRFQFLNAHRVVDDILPLAAGAGVLVRSVVSGQAHWKLALLGTDAVAHLDLPMTGTPDERLRGDAAGNRIVLLQGPADFSPGKTYAPSHLIVAELGVGGGAQ